MSTRNEDGLVKHEQFWKVARQVEDALIYTDADSWRIVGDEANPLGEVRIDFELEGDPYTLVLLQRDTDQRVPSLLSDARKVETLREALEAKLRLAQTKIPMADFSDAFSVKQKRERQRRYEVRKLIAECFDLLAALEGER